jgi:hypothetical protein
MNAKYGKEYEENNAARAKARDAAAVWKSKSHYCRALFHKYIQAASYP